MKPAPSCGVIYHPALGLVFHPGAMAVGGRQDRAAALAATDKLNREMGWWPRCAGSPIRLDKQCRSSERPGCRRHEWRRRIATYNCALGTAPSERRDHLTKASASPTRLNNRGRAHGALRIPCWRFAASRERKVNRNEEALKADQGRDRPGSRNSCERRKHARRNGLAGLPSKAGLGEIEIDEDAMLSAFEDPRWAISQGDLQTSKPIAPAVTLAGSSAGSDAGT